MQKIIIAIDGYSACGKSTLARQLAKKLSYLHIDSGATYRAITLYLISHQISFTDKMAVQQALQNISLSFVPAPSGNGQALWMNGENVADQIRDLAVANKVSEVAMIPEVRTFAVDIQRKMSEDNGVVMDGRDVGTEVFPNAPLKIFMTADFETRGKRRWEEMKQQGKIFTLEEIKENLAARDYKDTHRAISPLRQAPDAIKLDNTHLTEEEQLDYAFSLAKKIIDKGFDDDR